MWNRNYLIKVICFSLFIVKGNFLIGQIERKELVATRVENPPKIDGSLDDEAWQNANPASDFYQYRPYNDRGASFPTYVYLVYDDNAIYIGARLFDPNPDSILTELGIRDAGEEMNADKFSLDINPFNDGVNGFTFKVSASGVQTDVNRSSTGRRGFGRRSNGDINWDAVWKSEVEINDDGWVVEMEIPYSALRFPKKDVQEWGINFWRDIRRLDEYSSWNFSDREVRNQMNYLGVLKGVEGIKPPLRLSLNPYVSAYLEKSAGSSKFQQTFNGGMDLKWGINESFTLDMTLIPDFGQVKSDDKILNLTPYEVRYDENRQFFTEGTELFQRANLFYSRRVGSEPIGYDDVEDELEPSEEIIENPTETRMINATKISGRTGKGLGIGFLNAMTTATYAVVKNTETNEEREILTQPFTNYNILVADQTLKNNSYISLINTNTLMNAIGYSANVTGTELRLNDKSNLYGVRGEFAVSQQYYAEEDNILGHKYDIRIGKFGGKIQYSLSRELVSDTYDQNDLGYLRRNNEIENSASIDYNIFKPFGKFLSFSTGLNLEYNQLYAPREFTELSVGLDASATFVNRLNVFFFSRYRPLGEKDFYEPRVDGRYYKEDNSFFIFSRISTDDRKKIAVSGDLRISKQFSEFEQKYYGFEITPRFRMNDKLNFALGIEYTKRVNSLGYITDFGEDSVYFGMRQSPTWVYRLNANYIFTNKISLGFDLRHYWSRVKYDNKYYFLNEDGSLTQVDHDFEEEDINYNAFTIDMVFKWNFAPGSWLTAVWKNTVDTDGEMIDNYFDNVDNMFKQSQVNSVSLKLLYYIDYQQVAKAFKKS
jgi:hypothetical protein